jgi:uncharacterized repeat protein (TIGR03943 family)
VNVDARTTGAACLGILMVKLVTTGGYRAYVRPRMSVLLLLAGFCLLVAAIAALRSALAGDAHEHRAGRRLDLLVLVPIVLIAVMPPVPLGAAAAAMRAGALRAPTRSVFPPLPRPVRGAVPLTVSDFVGRALYDAGGSLKGVRVRLVGLVASEPGGFLLVRFAMFCCAADAIPMRIHIRGARPPPPAQDSWVEVTGTWRPAPVRPAIRFDPIMMPTLDAVTVRSVPEPSDPYDPPF